jgi:hypothetical protein
MAMACNSTLFWGTWRMQYLFIFYSWVSGSIHRAIGLLSNGERAEFHRQLAVFMQAHNQYSLCVMDGDFSATAASRYRSPCSTETAASWIFITTNEVSYNYIYIYTFILLRASTDHRSTTVVRNFTFLQLKELPSKSALSLWNISQYIT